MQNKELRFLDSSDPFSNLSHSSRHTSTHDLLVKDENYALKFWIWRISIWNKILFLSEILMSWVLRIGSIKSFTWLLQIINNLGSLNWKKKWSNTKVIRIYQLIWNHWRMPNKSMIDVKMYWKKRSVHFS